MKIILEKDKCIGCRTCAALCPRFFEMQGSVSHLKGSKEKGGMEELEIKEDGCYKEAQEICPVNCIKVK